MNLPGFFRRVAHLSSVLCCVLCCACLRSETCANAACVPGLTIPDCPFGFLEKSLKEIIRIRKAKKDRQYNCQ